MGVGGRSHSRIEAPRSILILKPSSFGDIVHTLPAVARLKEAWPGCRLSWLINTEWAPLLAENPDVDEIVPFPRQTFRGLAGPGRFVRWCRREVSKRRPTLAVDFQGLLRSAVVGRLSRPGRFYGLRDAREGARWLYDEAAPTSRGVTHAVDRYLALAGTVLGRSAATGRRPGKAPIFFRLPQGSAPQPTVGPVPTNFVLLHPFARGTGKSLDRFQIEAFCRRLAPRPVVLVGRRGEGGGTFPGAALDLFDRTSLTELIWLMRQAACVVTVDSGPSHLAAALGRPLVAIHTWSDPRLVGPYREDAWVWKHGRLATMRDLRAQPEAFFRGRAVPLTDADVYAICALATSLSDSCA